jgi:ABC-type nitrate/sulfonate/bicarbonate transport system permease component
MTGIRRFWAEVIIPHRDALLALTTGLAFIGLWELLPALGLINPFFVSSPTRIFKAGQWLFAHGLWHDIGVSLTEFMLGMLLAIVLGVGVGFIVGWYRSLNAMFEPFITILNATPRIALLPLIILWLGIGIESKIAAVFLGAFFPIAITVMKGVGNIDETLLRCARSFGANDHQTFATLVMPSSIPFLVAGLHIAVGRGLVGVVIGEMLAAQAGVGYMMSRSAAMFQTDKVFVGLILLASFGYFLTELLKLIEKRIEDWRPL